jgi:acyl carrier protein
MNELKNIISEYVGISADSIKDDTSLVGDIGLDSFGMVSLLCTLEDTFQINIPDNELSSFQTFHDLADYLEENSPVFA